MVANTTASRKAKGRNLQKEVVASIRKHFPFLTEDDVISKSMGAGGEDVVLSKAARAVLPFSVECKATEKFSLWDAFNQAAVNAKGWVPIVVHRKSRTKPVVIVDMEYFIGLHADCDRLAKQIIELEQ
jgi:hypothetical protein